MTRKKIGFVLALAALGVPLSSLRAEDRLLTAPAYGQRMLASIGAQIYSTRQIHFDNRRVAVAGGSLSRTIYLFARIEMRPGAQLLESRTGTFCTREPVLTRPDGSASPICLRDSRGVGYFDFLEEAAGIDIKNPIPYSIKSNAEIPTGATEQSTALIYLGGTSDALRLSYREFANDMARPAFTEELSIPLDKRFPQAMVVKGVRFNLYRMNGEGLEYEIVAPPAAAPVAVPAGVRNDGVMHVPAQPH